jgi:hypothetical protein
MRRRIVVVLALAPLAALTASRAPAQGSPPAASEVRRDLPLRQATPGPAPEAAPLTLRDTARDDRWIGIGVRGVRWSPDGRSVYFRWNPKPAPGEEPEADPWFRAARDGRSVERVPDGEVHAGPRARARPGSLPRRFAGRFLEPQIERPATGGRPAAGRPSRTFSAGRCPRAAIDRPKPCTS